MSSPSPVARRPAGDAERRARAVPKPTRVGGVVILLGVLADLAEHTVVPHVHDAVVAGFPVGEHAAHLVVLVGMVLVLVGIVVDGTRTAGRATRPERSAPHALR